MYFKKHILLLIIISVHNQSYSNELVEQNNLTEINKLFISFGIDNIQYQKASFQNLWKDETLSCMFYKPKHGLKKEKNSG